MIACKCIYSHNKNSASVTTGKAYSSRINFQIFQYPVFQYPVLVGYLFEHFSLMHLAKKMLCSL